MEVRKWWMILKYMYMLYVYMCVTRFCPLVDRERPDGAGEDAATGDGGGKKWAEDRRCTGTKGDKLHTVEPY
ncbi:hypothetical protein Hanom_Chr02g00142101 [Helianthus anomalus]